MQAAVKANLDGLSSSFCCCWYLSSFHMMLVLSLWIEQFLVHIFLLHMFCNLVTIGSWISLPSLKATHGWFGAWTFTTSLSDILTGLKTFGGACKWIQPMDFGCSFFIIIVKHTTTFNSYLVYRMHMLGFHLVIFAK